MTNVRRIVGPALAGICLFMPSVPLVAHPPPGVTGLDHIPIAVRDLDAAAADYRSLGFALKPGRPHDNGITNQHVKFPDGTELELITAPEARDALTATYRKHLEAGDGPAFLALYAPEVNVASLGLDADPLRYIFMFGRNQSPTDRPEHFAHPNTAESLIGVWLAGDDLSSERRLLGKLGARITPEDRHVPDLHLRASRYGGQVARVTVAHLVEGEVVMLPGARQLVPGRRIVGATLRVRDLAAARRVLAGRGQQIGSSIVLPPGVTHGLWLELRAEK
jgi:catechol 2,3-dioxygenase-like lactoylglutathione lyase family enzyme